jgi:MFS family permease
VSGPADPDGAGTGQGTENARARGAAQPASASSPSSRAVFRNRDFRLFSGARLLSGLALQMQNVGIGWFVYELTQSAWALGLVGLFAFLPAIAFALVTGQVADSFDRRLIVMVAHGTATAAGLGLLACAAFGTGQVWPVYLCAALVGTGRAFGNPASQAMLPNLVPREQFGHAIAWNSSIWQTATISGPAFGGILYALGPAYVFATAAASFAVAAVLIGLIRPQAVTARREKVTWETLSAGLSFIRSRPMIFGAISLDLVAVLLGGATALLPIFAQDILGVGPLGMGLLRSAPAVGALGVAVWLAHRPLERHAGRRMLQSVAVYGVATVAFGLSTSFVLSLACLAVIGAADMVSVVIRQTLVQSDTPDALRGRVAAVNTVFIGASNELGEFESGTLAALIGAVPAVVFGGAATIAVAGFWTRLFPALARRDRLVAAP